MGKRRLAAFTVPLAHRRWRQLSFDGERWFLWPQAAEQAEQALDSVQVALEWPSLRWLRLRWRGAGWRRLWPHELHLWLRRRQLASEWPLIGAALAQSRGRDWLGRR